ncbi:hypothetical protein HG530_006096 [Fusarium avenaceum]|nr:hypothetical protein HG530_006096 [Fusarium avenaceum]
MRQHNARDTPARHPLHVIELKTSIKHAQHHWNAGGNSSAHPDSRSCEMVPRLFDPGLGVGLVLFQQRRGQISHSLSSLEETLSVIDNSLDNVHLALTGSGDPGGFPGQVGVGLEELFCRNDGSTGDQRGRDGGRRLAVKADILSLVALGLFASLANDTAKVVEDTVVVTSTRRVIALQRQRNTRLKIRVGHLDREDWGDDSGGEVGGRVPLGNGVVEEEVDSVLAQTNKIDALVLCKASDSLDILAGGPAIGVVDGAEQMGVCFLEEVNDGLGATVEIKLAGRGNENVRRVLGDGAGELVPLVDGDIGGEAEVGHDLLHVEALVGEVDVELGALLVAKGVHESSGDLVVGAGGLYEHNAQRLVGVLTLLLAAAHPGREHAIVGGKRDLPAARRSRNR